MTDIKKGRRIICNLLILTKYGSGGPLWSLFNNIAEDIITLASCKISVLLDYTQFYNILRIVV